MTKDVLFWVLMLIWLVLGFYGDYVPGQPFPFRRLPGWLLLFVILALLGWRVFGAAVK